MFAFLLMICFLKVIHAERSTRSDFLWLLKLYVEMSLVIYCTFLKRKHFSTFQFLGIVTPAE